MMMASNAHDLTLRHYARNENFRYDSNRYYSQKDSRGDKPRGLWVSVLGEDDWYSWCRDEDFCVDSLDNEYEVTLTSDASILLLTTADAVRRFTSEYSYMPEWMRDEGGSDRYGSWFIDWERVAQLYAGIVIAPYQWDLRYDNAMSWYYGWDCASGCIWDLSAVAKVGAVVDAGGGRTAQ